MRNTQAAVKDLIKGAVLAPLYHSGALRWYMRNTLRQKAVVLTYHRVLPLDRQRDSFSAPGIVVTPATFEMHMALVRRFLQPVSAEEFARLVNERRPFPEGVCLVTFDDGWYDNHVFALPILKRHGVPAVVFVATDYIGSDRCFWQERLARMLYVALEHPKLAATVFERVGVNEAPATRDAQARHAIREMVTGLKTKPIAEVLDIVGAVAHDLGRVAGGVPTSATEDRFMTWEQVNDLRGGGLVSIGSHAMTHIPLTQQLATSVRQELTMAREVIQSKTGSDCGFLAYPNGDFDEQVVGEARAAGYSLAFTTRRGHVTADADPLALGRINVHEAATRTPGRLLSRIGGLL